MILPQCGSCQFLLARDLMTGKLRHGRRRGSGRRAWISAVGIFDPRAWRESFP